MEQYIGILKNRRGGKDFYSVHRFIGSEAYRLFGNFNTRAKADRRAAAKSREFKIPNRGLVVR